MPLKISFLPLRCLGMRCVQESCRPGRLVGIVNINFEFMGDLLPQLTQAEITPRGCIWLSRMRVQGHAGSEPLPPGGLDLLRQGDLWALKTFSLHCVLRLQSLVESSSDLRGGLCNLPPAAPASYSRLQRQ